MLYELTPFDKECMDFYDLFYLTKDPGDFYFKLGRKKYRITVADDDEKAIEFAGKWYRDFADFCRKAEIKDQKFTTLYDDFYDWEVA